MCLSTSQSFAFPFSLEILNTSSIPAHTHPPPPQIGAQNSGTQPTLPAYIFFSWHLQVNQLELTKSTYQLLLIHISNQAQDQNSVFLYKNGFYS